LKLYEMGETTGRAAVSPPGQFGVLPHGVDIFYSGVDTLAIA